MAALPELEQFDADVFQIETDSVWLGGVDGLANYQGKALANRTQWLKAQIVAALAALDGHEAAADPHPQYATDASVAAQIADILDLAPANLDTLNELAAALGDDANFAATMTNALALKASIAGVQGSEYCFAAAGGTADAISAAYIPAITTDTAGRIPTATLWFIAAAANATTVPTFSAGTGAFTIIKGAGMALAAGDIPGVGAVMCVRGVRGANAAADRWVLINPATGIAGMAFASAAEAQALSIGNKAISPATLAAALQGANQSLGTSGYQKLPGGLILQWGSGVGGSAVTLPIAFNNTNYKVVCMTTAASTGSYAGPVSESTNLRTASTFTAYTFQSNGTGYAGSFSWFAIGY